MDEPTPGELMRAIQKIEVNQTRLADLIELRFKEQALEMSRNYVRIEGYDERNKAQGERLGRVEQELAANRKEFDDYKKLNDERARADRRIVWTSIGAPLLMLLIGLAIKLGGG